MTHNLLFLSLAEVYTEINFNQAESLVGKKLSYDVKYMKL